MQRIVGELTLIIHGTESNSMENISTTNSNQKRNLNINHETSAKKATSKLREKLQMINKRKHDKHTVAKTSMPDAKAEEVIPLDEKELAEF